MASNLTFSLIVTHTPSTGGADSLQSGLLTFTPAGDRHTKLNATTNSTGGTDNAIPFGTVPTASCRTLAIRNKSLTDSMDISYGTGGGFAAAKIDTIPAGDIAVIHPTGQVYIKAATASQQYEALIVET